MFIHKFVLACILFCFVYLCLYLFGSSLVWRTMPAKKIWESEVHVRTWSSFMARRKRTYWWCLWSFGTKPKKEDRINVVIIVVVCVVDIAIKNFITNNASLPKPYLLFVSLHYLLNFLSCLHFGGPFLSLFYSIDFTAGLHHTIFLKICNPNIP